MALATNPLLDTKRASVADAKLAYFEGDFERCLDICANIRVRSLATASEVALLTARAYLRTGRPREAQTTIVETLETHGTLDASLTAQMLLASAHIRQDDADTGIAMLVDAANRSAGAHFAIRSEIAFSTALGHWAKREIEAAQRYLALVDPRSDIIHARALELQAFCYSSTGEYRRSIEFFRFALSRLGECQASDRAIEARSIATLSILAAELFDAETARFVDAKARTMNWTSSLSGQRYLTLAHQALFEEFAGNTVEAYQFAAQARECAPSVAFEVLGWGLSSAIARNAGEHYSAVFFAQRAQQLLGTLNLSDLAGEERVAMLCVAENCAQFDAHNAALLLADYRAHAPANNFGSSLEDPRIAAHESFIAGVVAQASNERERACTFYRRAFDVFDAVGYVRRASTAAHALVELTGDEAMRAYLAQRLAGTNNYITKSLKNRAGDALAALESNSIFASLPPAQREVVVLVCKGKTNKEIAQLRYVGEQTVKNMLTKNIFPAFGISSRAALVSACLRGLEPTSKRQSRRGT